MSSPSPDAPKIADLAYQQHQQHQQHQAEEAEHILLSHSHQCQCSGEKCGLEGKPETAHIHCLARHHNVLSLTHVPPSSTSHIHPISQSVHVHVHASPKASPGPKPGAPPCGCHVDSRNDEAVESALNLQPRKADPDDRIEVSPLPPALPPRPPPRPRNEMLSRPRSRECKYLL